MKTPFSRLLLLFFTLFSFFLAAQDSPPSDDIFRLQNVATGEFLTAASGSSQPVTMSNSGDAQNTYWSFIESGAYYNIDSESVSGGTGILRAPGAGGPGGAYVVVSTLKAPPAADTDKTWTIYHNATDDTYRFESRTAGRFLYQEVNGTVTHISVSDTDDRSNWKLIPLVQNPVGGIAPDEDTNPDLSCPASGEFQNDNTREVDIPDAVNVGVADDRTCYSDYSESSVYGQTWGVYNITNNSNHWDAPNTLQPRIERSLSRSVATGVGSYAKFTGTLRILEVGDTDGTNQDGSYLMQTKGKHTGGGGPADPAICLYLAMPVYGDDGNGNQVQVSFNIVREQINYRGGSGADGRSIVFLKNVAKNEIVDIELEVGFREDPNDPNLKVHYSDAVIGGEAFNWNIPEPERGLESGIRYGVYRVRGGRAQMRWANTTYEKVEVADNPDLVISGDCFNLINVETGQFLTAAGGSTQPVTMSNSGDAQNTHWSFVESGAFYNIDSQSESGGTGILRAPGAGGPGGAYVIVSTLKPPPAADTDKTWTIHFDDANDTYRFESRTAGRYLYHNEDGTVTHSAALATDNRSVWQATSCSVALPLDFISFSAEKIKTGNQLNWEIGNQTDNSHFEILRGSDLSDFQSIGRVEDEAGRNDYQFLDTRVANQTLYYKIKQVDIDGRFSFSNIISMESGPESLVLYPNPVGQNEYFNIESQKGYEIFNSKGILLKSGTEKIIKMDLAKGVYFVKQNGSSRVKKFIVH
ncbi:T9SS type A sorting domain-containing protein [Neolewinella agarilytica]|nr:T9SS type A sorting domain-containing protein [Neolewinella agarilytica]